MRMDQLTSKLQAALSDAQSLAVGHDNNFIEPVHLIAALLDQKGGSVRPLLSQTGFNIADLRTRLQQHQTVRLLVHATRTRLLWRI